MFNKKSIGKRVVSPYYGIGTITEVLIGRYFPIKVKWDNYPNFSIFTLKGLFNMDNSQPEKNITLLVTKQGTPEARKIVAMLAGQFRYYRAVFNTTNAGSTEEDMAGIVTDTYQRAYHQAKQLLGESK